VCIILAGIDYRFSNPGWLTTSAWSNVSALQIASIVYAIVIAVLGFLVFMSAKRTFIIVYAVLLSISILFTLAVAILCIVAGETGFLNVNFGCNAKITGILDSWNNMDTYLQNVDKSLCSSACPCSISNTGNYTQNSTVAPFFANYVSFPNGNGVANFQGCPGAVQNNALTQTNLQNPNFDPTGTNFDPVSFQTYMARVETQFSCTGWCTNAYVNNGKTVVMFKYLFTDVNNGPALYSGCLSQVLDWLPGYLLAFGSVAMVLAGFQIVVLATLCCLGTSRRDEGGHQVYEEPERHVKVVERVPVVQNVPVIREMPVVRDAVIRDVPARS